jgi:hypothetical protein
MRGSCGELSRDRVIVPDAKARGCVGTSSSPCRCLHRLTYRSTGLQEHAACAVQVMGILRLTRKAEAGPEGVHVALCHALKQGRTASALVSDTSLPLGARKTVGDACVVGVSLRPQLLNPQILRSRSHKHVAAPPYNSTPSRRGSFIWPRALGRFRATLCLAMMCRYLIRRLLW